MLQSFIQPRMLQIFTKYQSYVRHCFRSTGYSSGQLTKISALRQETKLETAHLPVALSPSRKSLHSGKSTKTGCQDPKEKECICGAGGSSGGVTALGTLARSSAVTPGSAAWPWLPNTGSAAALRRPPATAPTEIQCQGLFSQNWHHPRTLIWFGQQRTWIQRTGQDWPKPVMAPCSLLSVTGLWEGMGPCWSVRYDGKSAGERFSLVKGGTEKSLCSITSLALCFKHYHVMPVMELCTC
ncbi:uncharacterized protein [Physeter macrocephalus]|uniref:Uncharacterized protein n=1 Tax=Physeter macrocephalus TaxID=9755 RepID=A0A455BPD5_PHYMC|nr:uncharacterized protein LOC114486304 [Physeter catodon]XP_028345744.1 uncharacterized protein LOC114486304 [Physeter catodon]|eukprot:XP_028345740.1 uncharacterized protein LOC114486304 [Physeter catodon]